jgi:transglutaminase-like putative cysteine protease
MEQEHAPAQNDGPGPGSAHGVIIYLVALLLTLPIFLLVHPHVPRLVLPIGHGWRLDTLLTFIVILGAFIVLVRRFQLAVYTVLVLGVASLTVTGLMGRYGFRDVYRDYTVFLRSLRDNTEPLPMMLQEMGPFPDADVLRSRMDFTSPAVRSFAVRSATQWFSDIDVADSSYTLVQAFSVFKVINSQWTYVSDVKDGEYFATASESAALLAGDCDDHAILMAASIKAIGGEVRLVRTTGHIYPELKVGDARAMERAAYLIRERLFPAIARHATLFYHTDANNERWINLDYTRHYPGGEVMNGSIQGILEVR